MSHTLHRRGSEQSFKQDFVLFAMAAKGVNEVGSNQKLKTFLEIVRACGPVNMGDMKTGNRFIVSPETVVDNAQDTSIVHGVFDDREKFIRAMKAVKDADLGISVIVTGLLDDVRECCRETDLKPHTCETSLGIWGQKERLPDEDVLRLSTMCGHGQVPFNLIKKAIEEIKSGRRTTREAAEGLAKPCQCGVFNTTRAAAVLEEIVCLWGVRAA
jgi:hypothetical protein